MRTVARKIASTVLVLLLAAPLLLPFALVNPDLGVPSCCRRNGNHRCALSALQEVPASTGQQVRNLTPRCPYRDAFSVSHSQQFAAPITARYSVAAPSVVSLHSKVESGIRRLQLRSHPKRGPPVLA